MSEKQLNDEVRAFWENDPCGTAKQITGSAGLRSREWFENVENYRYFHEPMIHAWAQFTRHRGARLLEVGVGAGTDHLQWARAGAVCHGVDLTEAAIELTRERLALYGLNSQLQRVDAQRLPFDSDSFDLVYSWGVIHHSEDPQAIINEIHRVLKPGGRFIGMMYNRRSVIAWKLWIKHALLKGRPFHSLAWCFWNHMESLGTKAYTASELRNLFAGFAAVETKSFITSGDKLRIPSVLARFLPDDWGWYTGIRARKQSASSSPAKP